MEADEDVEDLYEEFETTVINGSDMYIMGINGHSLGQTLDLRELENKSKLQRYA